MREHGVLRRVLLVYIESVPRLRSDPKSLPPAAIARAARLFRFPVWKNALSRRRLREAGEEFEEIERRMFGEHGFEDAVGQIERALGFADLARSTAPPPRQP